jgi:hypothetical protein
MKTNMRTDFEDGEKVTHLSTTEARGGSRSKVTRNVLIVSLVLVIGAFLAALAGGYLETARTGADEVDAHNAAQ